MIAGLPYDAEVEWLYMPHGSYVNTGVTNINLADFDISLTVKADGYPETASAFCGVYGLTSGSRSYGVILRQYPSGTLQFFVGYVLTTASAETNITRTVAMPSDYATMRITSSAAYFNGAQVGAGYSVPTDIRNLDSPDLWLCINARKDKTTTTGNVVSTQAAGWYKGCTIINNGVLVRDFIPVRVGQTGYLYDRITRRLFGNKGTGSFVLGPDVATPVMGLRRMRKFYNAKDYVQDGLVAMWDGIENAGWGVHQTNLSYWTDLTGRGADFQIGSAFNVLENGIEILNTVQSTGQGHPRTVTWTNNDNLIGEFVLDLSAIDRAAVTNNNGNSLVMFRVGGGHTQTGSTSCPCIWISKNGEALIQGYNTVPRIQFPTRPCSISWQAGVNRIRFNDQFISAAFGWYGSDYVYYPPILSAYAGRICPHSKILAMRLYSSLSDQDSLHNYAIDKARFNLP